MDAQEVEHEAKGDEQTQPVNAGEHRFLQAVAKGGTAGLFIGALLGLAVALLAKILYRDMGPAQVLGIVVGSLAGGIFLGVSVACGLHSDDIIEH